MLHIKQNIGNWMSPDIHWDQVKFLQIGKWVLGIRKPLILASLFYKIKEENREVHEKHPIDSKYPTQWEFFTWRHDKKSFITE